MGLPVASAAQAPCHLDDSFAPQLAGIQATLAAHNTPWGSVRGGIRDFVTTESVAGGFSPHRILASLQMVLNHDPALPDAKQIVGVAVDAARARRLDPVTVVRAIFMATGGADVTYLETIDPKVVPIIARHGYLSAVLRQMRSDYRSAINTESDPAFNYDRAHAMAELHCLGS